MISPNGCSDKIGHVGTAARGCALLNEFAVAGGHQHVLKGINKMSLVRHLCANPGLSRSDLAAAAQLTKSTVSLLVRELIEEGWFVQREVVVTGDLGRRPTPLFIDPLRLVLIGGDVGTDGVRAVATSLTGEILAHARAGYGTSSSPKACLGVLAAVMQKLLRQIDVRSQRVVGIGVGVPGGVDEANGFLHFAPNLQWKAVPVGDLLRERFAGTALGSVPLCVQNDADVAALGEMEFGRGQVPDPLLYLAVNQGVGAGVIVDERLLTGHRGFAGEVGHMVLQAGGPLCSCGRRGCAEALIGPRAMVPGVPCDRALAEVRRLVAAGDEATLRRVEKAGVYLGVLLQNLAAACDPECIVLGGPLVELGDPFLRPALRTLAEFSRAAGLAAPEVRVSRHGADAVAVGAAALARYRLTRTLVEARSVGARESAQTEVV
jgi:predicted NBD/HSP70 family sugar kinase